MLEYLALSTLNHLLAGADWARDRLRPFAGRHLHLSLSHLRIVLAVDPEGYFSATALSDSDTDARDVRIELPAVSGARMFEGVEGLLREARIEGNAEFAQELGFVLRNLRWDYEEDLSRLVGDIAAHRLTMHVGNLIQGSREAAHRLAENVAEYLAEEQAMLVTQRDLQTLTDDIRALSATLDTLERRLPPP